MMYYLEILEGRDCEFLEAWKNFSNEIQRLYEGSGSTIFRTETGVYVVTSVWPSKEVWQKFWLTKEIAIESLTQLKACLAQPSQPVELQPTFSNWHMIVVPENAGKKTPAQLAHEPHYEITEITAVGSRFDNAFIEDPDQTQTVMAIIRQKRKKTG